ncbi:ankyrin repeat domain-containing protein [Gordonia sp. ABSL11-1]
MRCAAQEGYFECVDILLKAQADPNARGPERHDTVALSTARSD